MVHLVRTKEDMIVSYQIRKKVFIEEQHVSYEDEFDLKDNEYEVYLLTIKKIPVATLRAKVDAEGLKLGRICTLQEYRNQGYASQLMKKMQQIAKLRACPCLHLEAQLQACSFYEKLGYKAVGEIFLDANIKHQKMILIL